MWKHDTERDDGRLDEERRESGRSEEALEEKIATDFINENWDADIERKQKEVALKPRLSQESFEGPICRICHEGNGKEQLISPCRCMGSMGMVHRTCVERWLGSSNSNKCEICQYQYQTEQHPRPFIDWLKHPARQSDRRNLIGDCICFFVLMPLASVSCWLCINGSIHFAQHLKTRWESVGLLVLSIFLLFTFSSWCVVAIRYHHRVYQDWSRANHIIKVIGWTQLLEATVLIPKRRSMQRLQVNLLHPGNPNTWPIYGNPLSTIDQSSTTYGDSTTSYSTTPYSTTQYTMSTYDRPVSKSLTDLRETSESSETGSSSPNEIPFDTSNSSQSFETRTTTETNTTVSTVVIHKPKTHR
ncbi:E3 ubiquitin-protein ligase MARCH3 [Lamellibrachia satsuma]|nr:E3 ubiquitin-protein ligase MARCH3 [Lamellibrachia satsuma]